MANPARKPGGKPSGKGTGSGSSSTGGSGKAPAGTTPAKGPSAPTTRSRPGTQPN